MTLEDLTQWIGIAATGGAALFALGQKSEQLDQTNQHLKKVEAMATKATDATIENMNHLVETKTKIDMIYDMLKEMRE